MLQVDDRAGSAELIPLLCRTGLEVVSSRLEYGDVSFLGFGPNQSAVCVGLEVKKIPDVLACIVSGRFAGHQLPGLVNAYDEVWLLVIGQWRARPQDGILEERRHGHGGGMYWTAAGGGQRLWMWRDVQSWLLSMQLMAGIRMAQAADEEEAVHWIKTCYNWHQREEHKSHLVMYSSKELYADTAMLTRPPLARRIASELPHIGLKRSADVAARFPTVEAMMAATEKDWRELTVDDNKRLGERGSTVYRSLRGFPEPDKRQKPVAKPAQMKLAPLVRR